jgi:hypothetical protein
VDAEDGDEHERGPGRLQGGRRAVGAANHVTANVETRVTRGRCYDHNFLRFSTIFGEKLAFFSKTNVMIKIWHNLALF